MDLRDARNPHCSYRTSLKFLSGVVEDHTFVDDSCKLQDVDDKHFNATACASLHLREEFRCLCRTSRSFRIKCLSLVGFRTGMTWRSVVSWIIGTAAMRLMNRDTLGQSRRYRAT
ncbi:hypothetical protein K1719_011238 [Acacia pycnantha]|nr:hypothetical protein K1719_011238 [Acacia pycnantha]